MKRVGIITLNGYFNYGNRLQNYALQELIKSLGFDVQTILVNTKKSSTENNIINFVKKIIKFFIFLPQNIRKNSKYERIRTERFVEFSKKYINETNYMISEQNIPKEIDSFDFFISGSDQVWNPAYNKMSPIYFLSFSPKNKRISYAASFGISELPHEVIPKYRDWLSDFVYLSVREEVGKKIIKKLTGRTALVVLDPTLMLSKEHWASILKQSPHKPKNKYVLTYFLGEVAKERLTIINQIAKEKSLEIVHLANSKDKKAYTADPSEFLDYINSAELILTDSFHGSVFSILFEKSFIVFDREGNESPMTSRIDTLLSMFKLMSRKWENIESDNIFNVDYSHVHGILKKEREKSYDFLKEALGIKNI